MSAKYHILAWVLMTLLCMLIGNTQAQYIAYPNNKTHIPDSVVYNVLPHVKGANRCKFFHGIPNLRVDYLKSGYDIGHCASAEDQDESPQLEYASFDFVNTMPQRPNLNRITWLALENYCREVSPCKVKIYWDGVLCYIGIDKVAVPAYCIKEVWYKGKYEKYRMPNVDSVSKHDFKYYKVN